MSEKERENHISHIREEEYASGAILRVIATVTNQSLLDLPPLNHSIDVDSLDRLFASANIDSLRFDYLGYEVTVEPDCVRVRERK